MSLLHMKIIKKKESKRKTRLMLNIEKYKDNILNAAQSDITCCVIDLFHNGVCPDNCKDCKKAAMKWLLEEYKEPVLDNVEREYLSAVIKPFRKKVSYISKIEKGYSTEEQFIKITVNRNEFINLPYFNKSSRMYMGMEPFMEYTLEELGL